MKGLLLSVLLLSPVHGGVGFVNAAGSKNDFCSVVKKVVTEAKQAPAATSFCSSYLSIPPTATTTVTSTVTSTGCAVPTVAKRGADSNKQPVPKPSCMRSYTVASVISSACSCLKIPAGTATATTTATSYVAQTPATFNIVAQSANTAVNGQYLRLRNPASDYVVTFSGGSGTAGIFALNGTDNLYTTDGFGTIRFADHNPGYVDYVFFDTPTDVTNNGYQLLTCALSASDGGVCTLNCRDEVGTLYNSVSLQGGDTSNEWAADDTGDTPIVVQIVPLS